MNDINKPKPKIIKQKEKTGDISVVKPAIVLLRLSGIESVKAYLIGKLGLLFGASIIFASAVVFTCLGLWGYQISLGRQIISTEQKTEDLQGQRNKDVEESFMDVKDRAGKLKLLLTNRMYPSRIFELLEESVISQVQFTEMNVDLMSFTVNIGIEASNYGILAKQVFVFEEDERIKEVNLSQVSMGDSGRTDSDLIIKLDPKFLFYE